MVRPLARRLVAASLAAGAVGFGLLAVRPHAPAPCDTAAGGGSARSAATGASELLDGRSGEVAVPVRIADAAAVRLLHRGDRIDVLAIPDSGDLGASVPGAARTVGAGLTVLAVPKAGDGEQGALVVLATDRAAAADLAGAGSRLAMSILPR